MSHKYTFKFHNKPVDHVAVLRRLRGEGLGIKFQCGTEVHRQLDDDEIAALDAAIKSLERDAEGEQ